MTMLADDAALESQVFGDGWHSGFVAACWSSHFVQHDQRRFERKADGGTFVRTGRSLFLALFSAVPTRPRPGGLRSLLRDLSRL